MTTLSLNLITDIQSTPRTDGEVVRRGEFLADTSQFEVFADTDCLVTLRTDLSQIAMVMEFFELSASDTVTATLTTLTGKTVVVKQPNTAREYRYIEVYEDVSPLEILEAILLDIEIVGTQLKTQECCVEFANTYVGKVGKEILGTAIHQHLHQENIFNTHNIRSILDKIIFCSKTL